MSTLASANAINEATRDLSLEWRHTRNYWRDAKAKNFEEVYLEKLPSLVMQAKNALEELNNVLRKVRTECE